MFQFACAAKDSIWQCTFVRDVRAVALVITARVILDVMHGLQHVQGIYEVHSAFMRRVLGNTTAWYSKPVRIHQVTHLACHQQRALLLVSIWTDHSESKLCLGHCVEQGRYRRSTHNLCISETAQCCDSYQEDSITIMKSNSCRLP